LLANKHHKKRVRKNHYKKQSILKRFNVMGGLAFGGKMVLGMALVAALSAVYGFSYGLVTQCDYFKAKNIGIAGIKRLSEKEVLKQASLYPEINILLVNLGAVRKRLLAHPDIEDADIVRKFPDGLTIRIKEHEPLAIVDLGRRFLIDVKGKIYKEWTTSDPKDLPEVSGLQFSDLGFGEEDADKPFAAVMQVLLMGKDPHSILPNAVIKKICVDREIGVTLYAYDQGKAIKLGYNDYPDKYERLEKVTRYLKNQFQTMDFEWIDLMNAGRIVVNPIEIQPTSEKGKEV
jgi:cell division protein FtsQ